MLNNISTFKVGRKRDEVGGEGGGRVVPGPFISPGTRQYIASHCSQLHLCWNILFFFYAPGWTYISLDIVAPAQYIATHCSQLYLPYILFLFYIASDIVAWTL